MITHSAKNISQREMFKKYVYNIEYILDTELNVLQDDISLRCWINLHLNLMQSRSFIELKIKQDFKSKEMTLNRRIKHNKL